MPEPEPEGDEEAQATLKGQAMWRGTAELKKAVELKDPQRQIHREIRLKQLYLDQHAAQFAFDRFARLRDPQDYAASKMFGFAFNKDALAAGMLKHSGKPIHISLTNLPPPMSKEGVKCFKSIMGYMGDRKYVTSRVGAGGSGSVSVRRRGRAVMGGMN